MTEQELDQWLTSGMAALHNALDDVLDVAAGLADAQLPALQATLVQNLDDVLDLDAGLDHILPTPTHSNQPATDSAPDTPGAALSKFADDLCSRSPQQRLAARIWFPVEELIALQSTVFFAIRARDLACDVAATRARGLARALDNDLAANRDRDIDLIRASGSARALVNALAYARDINLVSDLASALATNLDRALVSALARASSRARALARASARANSGAGALPSAFANALVVAVYHATAEAFAGKTILDDALDDAVDRLTHAVTEVTGDDLTQVDLRGVPLEGLRWSDGPSGTRWPAEWEDRIRRNSVEMSPGLYEIRSGGIEAKTVA